jgi:hypothetical protein
MTLLACCCYLLVIFALGNAVLACFGRPLTIVQLAGLAPALGSGTIGLLLFWISLLGFAPSRAIVLTIGLAALAALLFLKSKKRLAPARLLAGDWKKNDWWTAAPVSIILLALFMIVSNAVSTPLMEWDAFAIWGLKAKVVADQPLLPAPPYFHDLTFSYSHLDYPLMLPFLTAGGYATMGTIDDHVGKLVSAFLDALTVPLVYLGLRWKLKRMPACCLSAILAALPAMFRYAGVGCADVLLTMYYAGSIFYVAKWIEEGQWKDLMLAILFSSFAAFTKNEGAVLALFNGSIILAIGVRGNPRRNAVGAVAFAAGTLALSAPWVLWSRNLPHSHEDYSSRLLSLPAHLPALKQVIPAMLRETVNLHEWGLVWYMTAIIALLGWRAFGRPPVLALWILLALHLAVYAAIYCVTPWNLDLLLSITLDRLLFCCLPPLLLLAGWHWSEAR